MERGKREILPGKGEKFPQRIAYFRSPDSLFGTGKRRGACAKAVKLRGLTRRVIVRERLRGSVQVVRSDQSGKSSINVVGLSWRSMRLQFRSFAGGTDNGPAHTYMVSVSPNTISPNATTTARAARRFAALLCVAAVTLPVAAFGQSRETSKLPTLQQLPTLQLQSREALGEGDSIRITVFQNPDLTTETRISERGTITFPLVGEISLAGLTPVDAEARIADKLIKGKFVLKPQVSLNVIRVRSRQVSVLGQVARPGRYPLADPSSSLTDILELAGGIGPTGDDNVTVTMKRGGKIVKIEVDVPTMCRAGDFSRNIRLENGDVIFVQRAPVFYIYGEVQRAGSYRLEQAMTVMQALSVGGGVTPRGTDRGLKIRRRAPDGTFQAVDARLTDLVQPNDVIYVRESLF